ncbi:CotH family protein [Butyrivibrio proteoclasticus B316]|uniref:CotH family protein n=1 Tax=Butyrivibrio proteoclasticus (strain ATCC 51982 / DSM 14932 / B316) TaxID=515622 RepID=E0RZN5_BUTPB|nr:CotH kinase family protein [Butyrivibrio proteoclasticus]ADL35151.1 CotH family protein [Butyrivibrio proteoclasticus B316]
MKKSFFSNFRKRDVVVVVITIVAIVLLFLVIRMTRNRDRMAQQELLDSAGASETSNDTEDSESELLAGSNTAKITINEVDGKGNIELLNGDFKPISIGGYIVSANGKETIIDEGTSIDAKGLCVVQVVGIDADSDSNVIQIFNDKKELVRAISFGKLSSGTSYGCLTDGSYEVGYINSSVGESNEGSTLAESDEILLSVPSGFYEEPFDLEIIAPKDCKLFYTTDGTIPTTDSEVYESKISISRPSSTSYVYAVSDGKGYTHTSIVPKKVNRGTVINVIAVNDKNEIVSQKTASYYVGYNNDADYVGLPVLSIEVDPDEMFGFEKGIYVPGKSYYDGYIQGNMSLANYLNGNSAKAKIEYFEPCKDKTYSGDVSITIMRDERRGAEQRSMVIKAESDYPSGTGLDEFLNSSSNYLQLLSGGGDVNSKIRNYFVKGITEGTNVITRDFQPCMVFIDGEFWGMYSLATNYDEKYLGEKYGVTDKVIKVETDYIGSSEYREFYNYVVNTDFSVPENYENLKSMMDISNYIEFMCANIFIGNTIMDRGFSACVFRTEGDTGSGFNDGRWRWAINSVDNTLGNTSSFLTPYKKGDFSTPMMNTYLSPGIRDNAFFNSILQNDSFAKEFEQTMNELVENAFTREHADVVLEELNQTIGRAVYATNLRFYSNEINYYESAEKKIKSFFSARERYLDIYTKEYIGQKGNVSGKVDATDEGTEGASSEFEEMIPGENQVTDNSQVEEN